jgi:hypothetical protein
MIYFARMADRAANPPDSRPAATGLAGLALAPVSIAVRLSAPVVDASVRALDAARIPERAIDALIESGGADRLIAYLFESGLFGKLTDRLLASDELDRIVSQVAQSDEVLAALRSQSLGLADEVAGEVRGRADTVDDVLERVARRLLRRPARPNPVAKIEPSRPRANRPADHAS